MTYQVSICTHNRPQQISTHTLRMLADGGVPADRVHLFVTPGQEKDYQNAVDPALYGHLHTGAPGLAANRNAATAYFPQHARIVSCDDDLQAIETLTPDGQKLQPITDVDTFYQRTFLDLRTTGASLWGIYPVRNAYFMRTGLTTSLKFCIGMMFGYLNRKNETITISEKEDYERTLLRWHTDGVVNRYGHITVKAPPVRKNPGGMQDGTRNENARNSVAYLQARWPQNVRLGKVRDGYQEIRLVNP